MLLILLIVSFCYAIYWCRRASVAERELARVTAANKSTLDPPSTPAISLAPPPVRPHRASPPPRVGAAATPPPVTDKAGVGEAAVSDHARYGNLLSTDWYDEEDHEFARRMAALDERWTAADKGVEASFTYFDEDGVVTERTVRNWRSDGPYIQGFCLSRRQNRTFRKDRIEEWVA